MGRRGRVRPSGNHLGGAKALPRRPPLSARLRGDSEETCAASSRKLTASTPASASTSKKRRTSRSTARSSLLLIWHRECHARVSPHLIQLPAYRRSSAY